MLNIIVFFLFATWLAVPKPVMVVDIIRHGARAATAASPFFPNITWSFPEELTSVGLRQQYLLGRLRRDKYVGPNRLLPLMYNPGSVYARSTDIRRTMMSAQAYLLGLYPTGLSLFNDNQTLRAYDVLAPPVDLTIGKTVIDILARTAIPFSVPLIPIHTVNYTTESLLVSIDCPLVMTNLMKFFGSAQYMQLVTVMHNSTWEAVRAAYPQITLSYLLSPASAFVLADFIICAAADGRTPPGLSATTVEGLKGFAGETLRGVDLMDPLMNPLGMQGLTHDILAFFDSATNKTAKPKYVLYSAHDVTAVVVMDAMHKLNSSIDVGKTVPEFAANVLFELNSREEENMEGHYVTVYYNGEPIHSESYSTFRGKFAALGELGPGLTREVACRRTG